MSNDRPRTTERSLKSLILEAHPNFYEDSNPANQVAYVFTGRKFKGYRPYENYTPIEEEES